MSEILPRDESLDIAGAIRAAALYLEGFDLTYGHGTGSAMDDAAWLVLEAAGLSPVEQPDYRARFPAAALASCDVWLKRRAVDRVPAAYLTGRTWFAGLEFIVDSRALVPRSPIAELITAQFDGLLNPDSDGHVLDLCTGGGCIAIATAVTLPRCLVHASDLSSDALALAAENCQFHQVGDRVELIQSDLFRSLSGAYDLIVSNPPYVDSSDIASMGGEFLHEPALGLASGSDGLDITRQILCEASQFLKPGGHLVVEVGNSAEALEAAFPAVPFAWFEFEHGGSGVFVLERSELPVV